MKAKDYFKIQLELEGLTIYNNNIKTISVNHFDIEAKETKTIPKLIVLNTFDNLELFYSELLDQNTREKISKLAKEELKNEDKVLGILNIKNIEIGKYVTYTFNGLFEIDYQNTLVSINSSDVRLKEFDASFYKVFPKSYAILEDNKIVACATSSRESNKAGEAWVYTLDTYRRKGNGTKAIKIWANDLIKNKKIPFYSHEINNTSSMLLAKSLGLNKVFEITVYEDNL